MSGIKIIGFEDFSDEFSENCDNICIKNGRKFLKKCRKSSETARVKKVFNSDSNTGQSRNDKKIRTDRCSPIRGSFA